MLPKFHTDTTPPPPVGARIGTICPFSGSEKGVFWKRGLFRKVHFLEISLILKAFQVVLGSWNPEFRTATAFSSFLTNCFEVTGVKLARHSSEKSLIR